MLTTVLIFFIGLIAKGLAVLPDWGLPDSVVSAAEYFINLTKGFDGLIPINNIFMALWYIFCFELAMWVLKIVISAWNYLRGSGPITYS